MNRTSSVILASMWLAVIFAHFLAITCRADSLPPDIRWEKIETAHFTIVYDSKQRELGELYARSAEQAFQLTSPIFGLWPSKTVILVNDNTDLANGAATGVPYPMIISFPVLPSTLDSVADYGNWGLELLTHEYTHVLNFEPANGVMKPLRYIFGSIVRPNIMLPRWYSEGLAVELETRLSSFGRLRSTNYMSIIRAMVEEGALKREDISRVNEVSIPDWPGGIRPYLMGALLMDELVRIGGDAIIGELNTAHSRRVPFFINGPVEERLGLNYGQILAKTYERAEKMTLRQIEMIRSAPGPEEVLLSQSGYFSHSPVISPDGKKIAIIAKEHNVDSLIYVVERGADGHFAFSIPRKPLKTGSTFTRISWTPDSKALIHDGTETFQRLKEYSDLWRFDFETKKVKQLTRGFRAREPVVSPDGSIIAFAQNTPGSTRLSCVKIDGSELTVLYTPPLQTRISRPEFLSAQEIIFSEKRDDGEEVFKILSVKVGANGMLEPIGAPRTTLAEFKPVHYPRLTKEGLLFVSDRSGVANLYLASHDLKSARAVTNTTSRILTGELDSQTGELYYSKLISVGPQIFRTERSEWSKVRARPPQVGPFVDQQWPESKIPKVEVEIRHEEYSPWWYLLPRYWMPYAYIAPNVSYYSASTSAADPTNRHGYALQASYDSLTEAVSTYGQYTNKTTHVPLRITAMNAYDYIYSGGFRRQLSNFSALGTFYLPKLSNNYSAALGWDYSRTVLSSSSLQRNGAEVQFAYVDAKKRGYEISPEKGGSLLFDHRHYLPGSSDVEYDVTDIRAATYLGKGILPERHVLAVFANTSLAPRLSSSLYGTSTISAEYQVVPGVGGLVMRGYNPGVFIGRNLWTATAEYRFPLLYTYRGYRTAPLFFQRFHADIFLDALTLDGLAYDYTRNAYNSERIGYFYYGTGAEVRLDATLFYHLPIQFIFGLHYGTDLRANPNRLYPVVSLSI